MSKETKFSGWRISILLALLQSCGFGLMVGFSPLINPIATDMGVSPGQVGNGLAVFVLVMTLSSAFLGPRVDKGNIPKIMLFGVVLCSLGLVAISFSTALWQMGIFLAIAAFGMACSGPLSMTALIVRWFRNKRGKALSITATGVAVAGFYIPVVVAWGANTYDWRTTVLGAAIISGVAGILITKVGLINKPSEVGQHVDGDSSQPEEIKEEKAEGMGFVKTSDFWLYAIGASLIIAIPSTLGVFIIPALEELGTAPEQAALSGSAKAIAILIATLSAGAIGDKFSPKPVMIFGFLVQTVALYMFFSEPSFATGILAAVGMGIAIGGSNPLFPILISSRFGEGHVASVIGIQGLVATPIMVAAPIIAGAYRDSTGDYIPLYLYAAFVSILASVLIGLFKMKAKKKAELASSVA